MLASLEPVFGYLGMFISAFALTLCILLVFSAIRNPESRVFSIPLSILFFFVSVDRWIVGNAFISNGASFDVGMIQETLIIAARGGMLLTQCVLLVTLYSFYIRISN